jgi:hypothetical protein
MVILSDRQAGSGCLPRVPEWPTERGWALIQAHRLPSRSSQSVSHQDRRRDRPRGWQSQVPPHADRQADGVIDLALPEAVELGLDGLAASNHALTKARGALILSTHQTAGRGRRLAFPAWRLSEAVLC